MLVGDTQDEETEALCTVCGGVLKRNGECTVCGARQELKDSEAQGTPLTPAKGSKDAFLDAVSKIPGLGPVKAEALYNSGYSDVELLVKATVEELAAIEGLGETMAQNVHRHLHPAEDSKGEGKEAVLEMWLKGEADDLDAWLGVEGEKTSGEKTDEEATEGKEDGAPVEGKIEAEEAKPLTTEARPTEGSVDALRRWLLGDEEGLEAWLYQPTPEGEGGDLAVSGEYEGGEEVAQLKAELTELKRAIRSELANVKEGKFDPIGYLEEIARLNRKLQQEVMTRKELESDLEHMEKSSKAVIKYVKSQKSQEEGPEAKRRLEEERHARKKLDIEVKKLQSLLDGANKEMQERLKGLPEDIKDIKEAERRLAEKEAELIAKEEELRLAEEKSGSKKGGVTKAELEQRLQAELTEKERDFLDKEGDMKKKIIELEGEVGKLRIEAKLRAAAIELTAMPEEGMDETLVEKAADLQTKERELLLREEEVARLKDDLIMKAQEIQKIREPMTYKEEELLRQEEDLIYREKLLQADRRKMEAAKAQPGNVEEVALKERLESLKMEITKKEEVVKAREKYLDGKMKELRLREQGLIDDEIESREEDRMLEMKQEKAKTGTPRLDDLLLGGVPFGSNVSVYGPPFIGKEIIVNAFMSEGLKKGIPVLWVITDKTPEDIREEMQYVLSGYEEYEQLGLVKYVDAYSKGMGADMRDPNVRYIDDPTNYEAILQAVDEASKELKAEQPYYRLAFRSISTLIAYLDPATTFRFLQPFAGRRKRDRAISFYVIEKGMHGEQEIQLLGSVMDGMIEFKVEQLKTYLSIKGVSDVQSRAWIQYMHSKQGLSIGSFSLDHIK